MQRGGEVVLQPLGEDIHVGDAREHCGDAVDVGCHRFEDQIPQPGQNRQRRNGGNAEYHPCGEPGEKNRRRTSTAPLDDAGEPADVGAVDHRHEAAHAGDQERDRRAGNGCGDQHPKPVTVGQQAHGHGAQKRHSGRERHHDRNDRGGRAQRRHHRCLRQLNRLQRTCSPSLARAAGRSHFSILPVAT